MNNKNVNILVVDDTQNTLEIIQRSLSSHGYNVHLSSSAMNAISILQKQSIDLIITDYKMPKTTGLELIRYIKENFDNIGIIMITGYATIKSAVEAVREGAEEYLCKPFTDEELFTAVNNSLNRLFARKAARKKSDSFKLNSHGIIGESKETQIMYKAIKKAAKTIATVLITGESGTGKELVARAIHYNSKRSASPFVPIHCGAIPENLFESELFGHVKGAFTGADQSRAGFFQSAEGGTIFLDEVSEISTFLQVKLLRVLQDKEFYMVGSSRPCSANVRIVAATNKDLLGLVNKGLFREDLYYRLNVIFINTPSLKDRNDDIFLLIKYFLEKFSKELGVKKPTFAEEALLVMKRYSWPGNIRELENVIQQIVVMAETPTINVPDLPISMKYSLNEEEAVDRPLAEVEAEYIQKVLNSVNNNKSKAAKILGIDRKTLRDKIS
jgi:two-component system, NtrC family, response regulator HydG